MTYDPFARGRYPVGVSSDSWTDTARDRTLPVEIWYPASAECAGQDFSPLTWDTFTPGWVAEGHATAEDLARQTAVRDAAWADLGDEHPPLVLLIHGWAGHRREATFVGTHLASRGYVVVSPDVVLSTYNDVDAFLTSQAPHGDPAALIDHLRTIADARLGDIPFLIDTAVAKLPVRPNGVGITGASYGGWSSLIAPAVDARVAAIVPMCPAGGDSPIADKDADPFERGLSMPWLSDAASLTLAADRDSLLPLYGQLELLRSQPATRKRTVVLAKADHNHFVDDIDTGQAWLKEFAQRVADTYPDGPGDWPLVARAIGPSEELVQGDLVVDAWQGLLTAHFDAYLRDDEAAVAVATGDIDALLAARGVTTYTVDLAEV